MTKKENKIHTEFKVQFTLMEKPMSVVAMVDPRWWFLDTGKRKDKSGVRFCWTDQQRAKNR